MSLILKYPSYILSEEQEEEKWKEKAMSALVHFVATMSQWLEKKIITMLYGCGAEMGGNQPGDKGGGRAPHALPQHSLSRGKHIWMLLGASLQS